MNIIQKQGALFLSTADEIHNLWQSAMNDEKSAAILAECGFDTYSKFVKRTADYIQIAALKAAENDKTPN